MKSSVKKFLAVALVGGALFGATGAQARDWDNGRGHDNGHRGYEKKVVHVHKEKKVKHVHKHYDSRQRYVYNDRYRHNDRYYNNHRHYNRQYQQPGRLIIGFNF